MIFSRGFFQILWRVLLLAVFAWLMSYSLVKTEFVVTPAIFGLFCLISITELYWFLRRQERNWYRFLLSIEHQDFTRSYQQFHESKQLRDAYELITRSFEQVKRQQESDHLLLKTVLTHIPIGLACYDAKGESVFANELFLNLIGRKLAPKARQLKTFIPGIRDEVWKEEAPPAELIEQLWQKRVLIKTESFKLLGHSYKLFSFMDISHTLDSNELESYQKLMRVMTHEIMNSTAPILSLIQVVNKKLVAEHGLNELEPKTQLNIGKSLLAIEDRTQGMLEFVEGYRKINKSITPQLAEVPSSELLDGLAPVAMGVEITLTDRLNTTLLIDKTLMMQVLINLITNAKEAVSEVEEGSIKLSIYPVADKVHMDVSDNGPGVKPEHLHQIFIPFYTTKETGSGIGLALSRKIVKAHGGSIGYERVGGMESRFRIIL
ncbi:MAG: sensor histidine kinase [Cytophagales bacterium]|nr:sensor histidine kinase [Cytophagales bacterium]